tara:strand:- start:4528 stop:5160 length:633 start_codon:yes stop_codon:yes gene_type:complete
MSGFGFELDDHEVSDAPTGGKPEYRVIEPTDHKATIMSADFKPTKKGGEGLSLEFQVDADDIDDEHEEDVSIRHWINTKHKNPEVVEIGRDEIVKLFMSCGLPLANASPDDLIGEECVIHIEHEEYKGFQQNRIKYFVFDKDEDDDEEEEEVKPKAKKKAKKKAKVEVEDDDEDDDEEEVVVTKKKKPKKKAKPVVEDDDEDDDENEAPW